MMNSFLFITHLTPSSRRSKLRASLYELHRKALHAQAYSNWKALVIGERELNDGKIWEVPLPLTSSREELFRELSLIYNRPEILDYINQFDYIVKLDDDDLISPTVLSAVSSKDFDVYYDSYHTFYDVGSGMWSQQKRAWIASTCIHKREHALFPVKKEATYNICMNSLLYTDHSKEWHVYYKDKKQVSADPSRPVYLRVLSPTSISSGAKKFPIESRADIDSDNYYKYLQSFGSWSENESFDFSVYSEELKQCWINFSGDEQKPLPFAKQPGWLKKVFSKTKN